MATDLGYSKRAIDELPSLYPGTPRTQGGGQPSSTFLRTTCPAKVNTNRDALMSRMAWLFVSATTISPDWGCTARPRGASKRAKAPKPSA
jgi:hypothetical protein